MAHLGNTIVNGVLRVLGGEYVDTINGVTVGSSPKFTDTTYGANNGVGLSGTTFYNSGVRAVATGGSNGTINVNTNGSTADVAVKGLGAMAYKASVSKSDVGLGNVANLDQSKAIKSITRSGTTFTATAIDGTTSSFTQQDNNTTYANVSTSAAGLAPKVTDTGKYLKGDGTWATPTNTTYSNVSTSSAGLAPKVTDTSKYLKGDGTWATPTNTTYSNATTAAAGLMSKDDKVKLNGIATGAEVNQNAFSNVTVGSTTVAADSKTDTLTLVGSNVTLTPDATNDKVTIGITKANVTSALGYTPPTSDTNTTYTFANGTNGFTVTPSGGTAQTVTVTPSVTKSGVGLGNVANLDQSKAIKSITRSGTTFTATALDGTTSSFTQQDNNTTYSNVSTSAAGLAPKVTNTANFLKGDGTWAVPTNTTYSNVSTTAAGLAPKVTSTSKFLKGDGTWATPTNTTYSNATTAAAGLMSKDDKVKLNGITAQAAVKSIATGTSNGTINVNINGTTSNVAVKGLAALAYKASLAASEVSYSNTTSGMTATKVQGAIDELNSNYKTVRSHFDSGDDADVQQQGKPLQQLHQKWGKYPNTNYYGLSNYIVDNGQDILVSFIPQGFYGVIQTVDLSSYLEEHWTLGNGGFIKGYIYGNVIMISCDNLISPNVQGYPSIANLPNAFISPLARVFPIVNATDQKIDHEVVVNGGALDIAKPGFANWYDTNKKFSFTITYIN